MVKFGLKLWSTNTNLIDDAVEMINEGYFDYMELTYVLDTEIRPFLGRNVDFIIHLPTDRHGVNIGDTKDIKKNVKTIQKGLEWVDKLEAKYAILHPGYGELKNVKSLLEKIDDDRILIENMPVMGLDGESMVGYSRPELSELKNGKFGFCLDLNHAIKASISLNEDYKEYIKRLLKLNPQMFHVADGRLDFEKDEHLNIGEGEYEWDFLMDVIKKSDCKYVTLETPRENLKGDFKNLKKVKDFL